MRRWLGTVALGGALLAGLVGPAQAAGGTDPCGDAPSSDRDIASTSLVYSASSFQVRTVLCGSTYDSTPNGTWEVVVHLTSFAQPISLVAVMNDVGKYADWSGFYACDQDPCPIGGSSTEGVNGPFAPAGVRLENDDYFAGADRPDLSARSGFGYDSWAHVLAAGTTIPDAVDFWTETRSLGGAPSQVDRFPDAGTVSASRNRTPLATSLQVTPGPAPTWAAYGVLRADSGTLLSADGTAVRRRYVAVHPAPYGGSRSASDDSGHWSTTYRVPHNTEVEASFPGDGVHDPARQSSPAYVKAFVSLDLKATTTVARGTTLLLRGVVRPRQSGQVQVLVREDRPGTTYRLLRYGTLMQGSSDSYFRLAWRPAVRGRFVLRARWNGGSTAAGGVLSNVSTYRRVTVT